LDNQLPPYSGTICPMCGFVGAKYRYCVHDCKDDGTGALDAGASAMSRPPTPHLHRICQRCEYEWLEATLPNRS